MNPFSFPENMEYPLQIQSELASNTNSLNQNRSQDPNNYDGDASLLRNKRARATPEQIAYLEASFNNNPMPNCKIREVIAQRIGMSERSIQIWFQNRRAKVKLAQRKAHIALQEEALRQHYLAARGGQGFPDMPYLKQPAIPGVPGVPSPFMNFNSSPLPGIGGAFSPYAGSSPFFDMSGTVFSSPSVPQNYTNWGAVPNDSKGFFPCTILSIGTWQRMSVGPDGLLCGFSIEKSQMAWVLGDSQTRYRISFSFNTVQGLEISFNDPVFAELAILITKPPDFAVLSPENIWTNCSDFTEGQQASVCLRHVIKAEAQELRVQFLGLLQSSPELSTVARILPAPGNPSNGAQMEARRRQSTSFLGLPQNDFPSTSTESMALLPVPENGYTDVMHPPQYMASVALERTKNRSNSLPTLHHPQPGASNSMYFDSNPNFNGDSSVNTSMPYSQEQTSSGSNMTFSHPNTSHSGSVPTSSSATCNSRMDDSSTSTTNSGFPLQNQFAQVLPAFSTQNGFDTPFESNSNQFTPHSSFQYPPLPPTSHMSLTEQSTSHPNETTPFPVNLSN